MTPERTGEAGGRCPEEGVLVAYLDGVLEEDARSRVERHVDECDACRERLGTLERASARVGEWLAHHDPQVPRRTAYRLHDGPGSGARGRWALAAGVVLAVALAAGPARGWLLERIGWDGGAEPAPEAALPVEEVSATSFAPRGATLTLSFEAGVPGRRVLVRRAGDSLITLRAPGPDVALLVGPGRVDVRDGEAAGRDYRLGVPEGVERVVLRVPGADSVVVLPDPEGVERVVDVPPGGG